ncbi:MAG: hypothetical protein H7X77_03735 [Anaerolineae bacterium]|nr:hypothetical protein [Anaerolineae bacterium]
MTRETPFDLTETAAIRRRARQLWLRQHLPRLLLVIHLALFTFGSFVTLMMAQQLGDRLGFPPGLLILGWVLLLILHWGGTAIWSSYNRAIDREFELEHYRHVAEKRKHTEADARLRVGDDGELVEISEDESYPIRQTSQKR